MTVIIQRTETTKDKKGRNITHLTTVFYANLEGEDFRKLVCEDNEVNDGANVDYEDNRTYQVTGTLILKYLDLLRRKGNPISELWKEDGISTDGQPFNIENQYYEVEVF